MTTINCTWEEFKRMAKEFHDAAPNLNMEELNNAWACLGLGYLGMKSRMWEHSAALLMKIECQTFLRREEELTLTTDELLAELKRRISC